MEDLWKKSLNMSARKFIKSIPRTSKRIGKEELPPMIDYCIIDVHVLRLYLEIFSCYIEFNISMLAFAFIVHRYSDNTVGQNCGGDFRENFEEMIILLALCRDSLFHGFLGIAIIDCSSID